MNAKLIFLGTGSAIPMKRGLPCIALKVDSDIYLFDVGEGCQQRLFNIGLSALKIKAIFITHSHGDHYLGLFGLIQSMNLLDRREELQVYTPPDLHNVLTTVIGDKLVKSSFQCSHIHVKEGLLFESSKIKVEGYEVEHSVPAFGFIVTLNNGVKIVYTGDTLPIEKTVEASRNSNILVHEATFIKPDVAEAYEQKHSTAADAALIAEKASVKRLFLTHISSRYRDEDLIFFDAYRFFKNVTVAKDYLTVVI